MPIDSVNLTEIELGHVDPVFFSTRLGYSKRATVVFTSGKGEPIWSGFRPADLGGTSAALINVDEAARNCTGTCMVDLIAVGVDSKTPAFTSRGQTIPRHLSPNGFRYKMVITVVHELFHISQAWQIGNRFWLDDYQEAVSAQNRAEDYAGVNPNLPNNAYLQNMFESGARNFTDRWAPAHADEIHKGKFDFLLPMSTLKGMFPDVANAFK